MFVIVIPKSHMLLFSRIFQDKTNNKSLSIIPTRWILNILYTKVHSVYEKKNRPPLKDIECDRQNSRSELFPNNFQRIQTGLFNEMR